jgi:hypothetical protein
MGHIFISYSHKDKDYVHKLQKALQKEGFEVWIDDRIDYGTSWPRILQEKLDTCDAFILVASENSYESEWVQNEVARAKRKGKPFFPLLVNGDAWLSVEVTQYVDVRDGSLPIEKFYTRLEQVTSRKNERTEREAAQRAEKAAREQLERDATEKARQEGLERESAERIARQQAERDAAEKAKREREERQAAQIAALKEGVRKTFASLRPNIVKAPPILRFATFAGIVIVLLWAASLAILKLIAPVPTATNTALQKPIPLVFSGRSGSEVNVYLYDAEYKTVSPMIAGGGQNWDPVIAASGNIYFTSNRDGKAEIYRRLINGKIERITYTLGRFESWGPVPSSSGNIYFTSNQNADKSEIYRLINGKLERMTYTPGRFESWGPVPSSSGNIYFTSNQNADKSEIYRLINGKLERMTYTPGRFESWGPILRGQNIYYTSNKSGVSKVYLLDSQDTIIFNTESWTNFLLEKSPRY